MSSAESVTWRNVMAFRLRRHCLDRRAPRDSLVEVVAAIGGIQAQLMSAAELAAWARVEDLERDAVQRALWDDRSLVKTWAMRGTLHLLPASELRLWQTVPALDRRYLRPAWTRYFGITAEELETLTAAVAEALNGQILTREELVAEVGNRLGSEELAAKLRHSWGMMLKPAAFRSQLCFAPSVGQKVRFTGPDSWLKTIRDVNAADADREITERFLAAYGPVTREVYAQWLGVPVSRAGKLIKGLGEEVRPVRVEDADAWVLTRDLDALTAAKPVRRVNLLPAFDQYVLAASRDAAHLLPGPFRDRIYRPQGWLTPVLLVNGRMDGMWKHERKGNRILVRIEPFVELPAWARKAATDEAERLAVFLGGKLEPDWETW